MVYSHHLRICSGLVEVFSVDIIRGNGGNSNELGGKSRGGSHESNNGIQGWTCFAEDRNTGVRSG